MAVSVGPIGQVTHFAGIAGCQPLLKPTDPRGLDGRARTGEFEPEPTGLLFKCFGERAVCHFAMAGTDPRSCT